jgi:hypothetical protein
MKRVILAALAGIFTLSLVGCEQRVDSERTPGEGTSTTILKDETTPTMPSTTAPSTTTPSTITTPEPKTSVDVNVKPEEKPAQ